MDQGRHLVLRDMRTCAKLVIALALVAALGVPASASATDPSADPLAIPVGDSSLNNTATPDTATSTSGPSISSNKDDYMPGEIVALSGSGWQPGEAVHILVNDDDSQSWTYDGDVIADENGTFTYEFQLPGYFVANYRATATGESGTATTTFTDTINA